MKIYYQQKLRYTIEFEATLSEIFGCYQYNLWICFEWPELWIITYGSESDGWK